MEYVCVDTDVLIDFLKGKTYAVEFIREHAGHIATTFVNLFELYHGARDESEILVIDRLQQILFLLNLSVLAVKLAGSIGAGLQKRGNTLDFRDIFIGSIALVHNCALKTNNKRHFVHIQGLQII